MALFLSVGLFSVIWAMNQEVAQLRITGPRSVHIRRGKAFRRADHWTDRARLWIADSRDSEGDPYFKLMMDAPGGELVVKEGHARDRLEALREQIETAIGRN